METMHGLPVSTMFLTLALVMPSGSRAHFLQQSNQALASEMKGGLVCTYDPQCEMT
jgi:hypothetical protein